MRVQSASGALIELTRGVHYNVSIAGSPGAVTVTRIAFPAAPLTVFVYRTTPALQGTPFADLAAFPARTHERLHDLAAMRDAELKRDLADARTTIAQHSAALASLGDIAPLVAAIIGGGPLGLAGPLSAADLITSTGPNAGFAFHDRTAGAAHAFRWLANGNVAQLYSVAALAAVLSVSEAGALSAGAMTATGAAAAFTFHDRAAGAAHAFRWFAEGNIAQLASVATGVAALAMSEGGTLTLTPPEHTATQALVINTRGPAGGSADGPYTGAIDVTGVWTSGLNGTVGPGTTRDVNLIRAQIYVGGPDYNIAALCPVVGVVHHTIDDTCDGDKDGGSFFVETLAASPGKIYGGTSGFRVGAGGATPQAFCWEVDAFIEGGTVAHAGGYNAWWGSADLPTGFNVGYSVGRSGDPAASGWKKAIALYTAGGATPFPLTADADFIFSDSAGTIANFVDFRTNPVAVTGNILGFPNVFITGGGLAQFGSATSAGGITIAGGAGDNLSLTTVQHGATPTWIIGATATVFYMGAAFGPAAAAWTVDHATNLLSAPSGLTVKDATFTVQDDGDASKQLRFQLSGITAGQTRTLTAPNFDGTIATLAGSEALTNKTINLTSNTLSGTTAQFNAALSDNDFATLAGSEALTNKTINLTSNTLSGTRAQFNAANSDGDFVFTSDLGTGVATALALAVGSAGAFVTFNGAGGTPSSLTLTNATGLPVSGIAASTVTALGVGSLELGHASDTTLARVSAGIISVEGVTVSLASNTLTLTNKTINLTSNALSGTTAQFNAALSDNDFATLAGSETLTNKTVNGATIDENAWSTYTPVLQSDGGAITTATPTGRYRRLFGRVVIVTVRAVLTNITTGTPASGNLYFSLPINASTTVPIAAGHGREAAVTGKAVAGEVFNATNLYCIYYDSTSVFSGGNGTTIDFTLTYEAAS